MMMPPLAFFLTARIEVEATESFRGVRAEEKNVEQSKRKSLNSSQTIMLIYLKHNSVCIVSFFPLLLLLPVAFLVTSEAAARDRGRSQLEACLEQQQRDESESAQQFQFQSAE
jgi:hypothetical protein